MPESTPSIEDQLSNGGENFIVTLYDQNGNASGYWCFPKSELQGVIVDSGYELAESKVFAPETTEIVSQGEQIDTLVENSSVVMTSGVVLIIGVFACLAAVCMRTLLVSFER